MFVTLHLCTFLEPYRSQRHLMFSLLNVCIPSARWLHYVISCISWNYCYSLQVCKVSKYSQRLLCYTHHIICAVLLHCMKSSQQFTRTSTHMHAHTHTHTHTHARTHTHTHAHMTHTHTHTHTPCSSSSILLPSKSQEVVFFTRCICWKRSETGANLSRRCHRGLALPLHVYKCRV